MTVKGDGVLDISGRKFKASRGPNAHINSAQVTRDDKGLSLSIVLSVAGIEVPVNFDEQKMQAFFPRLLNLKPGGSIIIRDKDNEEKGKITRVDRPKRKRK